MKEIIEASLAGVGAVAIFLTIGAICLEVGERFQNTKRRWKHLIDASDNHGSRLSRLEHEIKAVTVQVQCNSENIRDLSKTASKKKK